MREAGAVDLSVILVATDSARSVLGWIDSIELTTAVELIVVGEESILPADATYSRVRCLTATVGTSVPRLRRLGLDEASGPVVVFAEDSALPIPTWLESYRAAFGDPRVLAATGPVGYGAGRSTWDRVVYVFEYGVFAAKTPGFSAKPPRRLAGNNFAIRVDMIDESAEEIHEHQIPTSDARFLPDAGVIHVRRYRAREALLDRFRFGRHYGGLRWSGNSRLIRLLGLLATPAIAAVQAARMVRLLGRRDMASFRPALPSLLLLVLAWSVGEGVGWLTGRVCGKRSGKAVRPDGRSHAPPCGIASGCTRR